MRTKTVPYQLEQQGEEEKPEFRAGNVAIRRWKISILPSHPVIQSEILRGTVGAFAQPANFAEKCEGGHLNQHIHLKWTADGDENTICKEVDAEENCDVINSNDRSHLEVMNENCFVDFLL